MVQLHFLQTFIIIERTITVGTLRTAFLIERLEGKRWMPFISVFDLVQEEAIRIFYPNMFKINLEDLSFWMWFATPQSRSVQQFSLIFSVSLIPRHRSRILSIASPWSKREGWFRICVGSSWIGPIDFRTSSAGRWFRFFIGFSHTTYSRPQIGVCWPMTLLILSTGYWRTPRSIYLSSSATPWYERMRPHTSLTVFPTPPSSLDFCK